MNQLLTKLLGQGLGMPLEDEGGLSAPASPDAPTTPEPAPEATGLSEKDINDLIDHGDIDKGDSPDSPVLVQPASPTPPIAPIVEPPVAAPVAAPVAPIPPVAATPPQAPVTPPAAAVPPVVAPVAPTPPVATPPVTSPEVEVAAAKKRRDDFAVSLEKAYAFPEDKVAEVNLNPAAHLPKMAAQLHLQVLESATSGLAAILPQLIEQVIDRRDTVSKTENEFYAMWPQLDKANASHESTARNLLSTIVSTKPGISKVDAMKQAGAATLLALGIPYEKAPAPPPAAPTFSAGAPGANGPTPGRAVVQNPFEQLSRELEEDLN